jgi:hypothetical protein
MRAHRVEARGAGVVPASYDLDGIQAARSSRNIFTIPVESPLNRMIQAHHPLNSKLIPTHTEVRSPGRIGNRHGFLSILRESCKDFQTLSRNTRMLLWRFLENLNKNGPISLVPPFFKRY